MDRIALLRYHRDPAVCRSQVELLRRLDPDVPVYGVGEPVGIADALDGRYVPEDREGDGKWRHGDLVAQEWFRAVGRDLDFEYLHLVEWDLLLCAPLSDLYAHVPADGVALSGLRPMSEARSDGWAWITTRESPREYRELREHVVREFGHREEAPSCVFPGAAFPRSFLEDLADLEIPPLCNDEVRIALYAEALGYDLYDTGFHEWTDAGRRFFNGRGNEIPRSRIESELADPDGRRAFHPVREPFDPERIVEAVRS